MKICSNKNCKLAGILQGDSNFHKDITSHSGDGLEYRCIVCQRERCRNRKKLLGVINANNEDYKLRLKDSQLRCKFGISLNCFNEMLYNQDNKCKCCGNELAKGRSTHVHHNHITGEVIGLWCYSCNIAEGHMKTSDRAYKLHQAMKLEEIQGLIDSVKEAK